MKKLLVLSLFLGGMQAVAGTYPASMSLKQVGRALALGTALALAPLQISYAQEANNGNQHNPMQPAHAQFKMAVGELDPAIYEAAMLLRVSMPPENPDKPPQELAFHLTFIGIDLAGNSLLIARKSHAGYNVQEYVDGSERATLYGWDGVIADSVTVEAVNIPHEYDPEANNEFDDGTNGLFNLAVFAIKGLNLTADYRPLPLNSEFPYTEPKDVELLTYRLVYPVTLTEDEIMAGEFPLLFRRCMTIPQAAMAKIDAGLTTCGGALNVNPANSSPIVGNGQLVAIQSAPSTRTDAGGNTIAWWASAIPETAVAFSHTLNGQPMAINLAGKATTTWADLKKE